MKRILYSSLVDISLPTGPSVNERTFLADMVGRTGTELRAVLPNPSRGVPPELADLDARWIPRPGSVKGVAGWLGIRAAGRVYLRREVDAFEPDLMVFRVQALPWPQYSTVQRADCPFVIKTLEDPTFRAFYEGGALRRMFRRPNQRWNQALWNRALCVDVVSTRQREVVRDLAGIEEERIHVIDNGVDLTLFRPERTGSRRGEFGFGEEIVVLGYVGNYPLSRGGRNVIDCVASGHQSKNLRGLIVGDSGEVGLLQNYAAARGVGDRVVIYGEADYSEVPQLMRTMDVGLSILNPQERGESEQKVRQYLASGLVVVGTAGSNDFLRGRSFARVVESTEEREVMAAVRSLTARGPEGLAEPKRQARLYAETHLSYASRNDERLHIWRTLLEQAERQKVG